MWSIWLCGVLGRKAKIPRAVYKQLRGKVWRGQRVSGHVSGAVPEEPCSSVLRGSTGQVWASGHVRTPHSQVCLQSRLPSQHRPPDSGNLSGVVYLSSQSLGKHLLCVHPEEDTGLGRLSGLSWEGLPVLMAARRTKIGLMGSVAFGPHFLSPPSQFSQLHMFSYRRPCSPNAPRRKQPPREGELGAVTVMGSMEDTWSTAAGSSSKPEPAK